jgi:putative transposase
MLFVAKDRLLKSWLELQNRHRAARTRRVSAEGLDEMLTVVRLKLPMPLRRSLACTNAIENMMGTVRRVSRNVKCWRNAAMALRWTAAGMLEATKGFRRLKAHKYLPVLRAALGSSPIQARHPTS